MNDPCARLRNALNTIDENIDGKKTELTKKRALSDHYRNLIDERVEYTKKDRTWIRKFIANCKTASDARKNSASVLDVIDNKRPIVHLKIA